jgi:hypothetical protein
MNFKRLAERIIKKLKEEGVECYLWHAATTGSAYIRFKDVRVGSIRMGDHKGRSQYSYRWNVRSDFPRKHSKWHKINDKWRYYTHTSNWVEIIPHIVERSNTVAGWGKCDYEYYVPDHKKKKDKTVIYGK